MALRMQRPVEQRRLKPLDHGGAFRVLAAVDELLRIRLKVVEHRAEARGVDIFPTAVEGQEQTAPLDRLVQLQPHVLHGVVVFGEEDAPPVRRRRPAQQRHERPALEDMVGRGPSEPVDEGRREVDFPPRGRPFPSRASRPLPRGVDDDQRDARRLVVEEVLLSHPVVAEIVPVVRREDDHRALEQASLLEEAHQRADLVVDLRDEPHVGGDHGLPCAVARHVPGVSHVHVGAEDGMRVLPLPLDRTAGTTSSGPYIDA